MHLKTASFTEVVGETYTIVRNVYGRPGREPRQPGDGDFEHGHTRKFGWADAVAWRMTRDLSELGMTWDDAASLMHREYAADRALKAAQDGAGLFFAVWPVAPIDAETPQAELWAAGRGAPAEIAEMVEHDGRNYGAVLAVRMISVARSIATAKRLAISAGYVPHGNGFLKLDQSDE